MTPRTKDFQCCGLGFFCGSAGVFAGFFIAAVSIPAAQLTRGPYLQTGTPQSVIIKWRTDGPTDSRVQHGSVLSQLTNVTASADLTTEHEVRLSGLSPNTRYFYSIGSSNEVLSSGPEYFFVTAPIGPKATRVWALGDSGTANENAAAVRDAYYAFAGQRHTDLWLMLGDNAYQSGTDLEYSNAVFNMYPEMLRKSVLWPTIGNHDTYADPVNLAYLDVFTLPANGEAGGVASGTERYYSFNYGNIHFVCLDAMNSDVSAEGPMGTWLDHDLDGNTNFWLIAFWHQPPYSKGSHDSDIEGDLIAMRQSILPILESYGVDLVLCGHSHSYERSYLLNGHYGYSEEVTNRPSVIVDRGSGRMDESGPYVKLPGAQVNRGAVYVVAGCSGQHSGGSLDHPAMFISLDRMGSMVLDINGDRLDAQFLQSDGVVADHFTILKGADFRVTAFRVIDNFVSLSWISVPGKNYYVEFTPNLDSPKWIPVSGGIPANSTRTSWTGFYPAGARGFYRVVNF